MEDGRINFSHFVTLDVPEDSCYSSEHLDIDTDPFCRGAQCSHVILISPNIGEGMVPSLPSLLMETQSNLPVYLVVTLKEIQVLPQIFSSLVTGFNVGGRALLCHLLNHTLK